METKNRTLIDNNFKPNNSNLSLEEKVKISQNIISKAISKSKNSYALFTGGNDSLIMLHLIKTIQMGKITLPVLHIDTTVEFPEVYQFIEKMRRLWGFLLVTERNENALRTIRIAEDRQLCCRQLKMEALRKAIDKYKIDGLFLAKRSDGKKQDPFFLVHEKVNITTPIQNFLEKDIWNYIKKYNLPFCSFYDNKYYEITCLPCTQAYVEKKSDKRNDKSEDYEIAKRLKELGYL